MTGQAGMDTYAFADPDAAYDNIARAIAAYESSTELNQFSSPFDQGVLTDQQTSGLALFTANCTGCHSMDTVDGASGPLFTNYGYVNIT